MDQDQIVAIVDATGIVYRPGTRQKQWNQVRFFGIGTKHSLNLGYQGSKFVADFVFKAGERDANLASCQSFVDQFGGEVHKDKTVFCRVELPYSREAKLTEAIHAYWALDL